jgi:hypothetical protein
MLKGLPTVSAGLIGRVAGGLVLERVRHDAAGRQKFPAAVDGTAVEVGIQLPVGPACRALDVKQRAGTSRTVQGNGGGGPGDHVAETELRAQLCCRTIGRKSVGFRPLLILGRPARVNDQGVMRDPGWAVKRLRRPTRSSRWYRPASPTRSRAASPCSAWRRFHL